MLEFFKIIEPDSESQFTRTVQAWKSSALIYWTTFSNAAIALGDVLDTIITEIKETSSIIAQALFITFLRMFLVLVVYVTLAFALLELYIKGAVSRIKAVRGGYFVVISTATWILGGMCYAMVLVSNVVGWELLQEIVYSVHESKIRLAFWEYAHVKLGPSKTGPDMLPPTEQDVVPTTGQDMAPPTYQDVSTFGSDWFADHYAILEPSSTRKRKISQSNVGKEPAQPLTPPITPVKTKLKKSIKKRGGK